MKGVVPRSLTFAAFKICSTLTNPSVISPFSNISDRLTPSSNPHVELGVVQISSVEEVNLNAIFEIEVSVISP